MSIKVELNRDGVRSLLKSDAMMGLCKGIADGIAQQAGDGYEVSTWSGRSRVNASVIATTKEAAQDNLDNNTLLKAMGKKY